MKQSVALLAVLALLLGSVVPSDAWTRHGRFHHGGWWLPGAIIGGLVLGSAIAAPATPSVQREVVYPHGKYVLYGDGVTQPWQWVWVPAPPPPPPGPR